MPSKLTLLGSALIAWGAVAALAGLPFEDTRFSVPLISAALASATAGLVLSIIGAAKYERY